MPRRIAAVAILASVLAVVGACAGAPPASVSPSPASSVVGPGAALYGTYAATIPSGVNAAPGEWTLTVAAGGAMFTHPDGHTFSPGTVKELTASEIVFWPDEGCPTQEGTPTDGRYRWSVEGTSLTLEVVSDSCQDRIDTLTSSTWSRAQ